MSDLHTVFMSLRATPTWLALEPKDRFAFLEAEIVPILRRHAGVRLRFFDAEAYSADVSDVAVWETDDLRAYRKLVDDLRETRFWGAYFDVVGIVPAVENDYARSYGRAPLAA
ncbi:MAG: darcynin family protein [Tagaea sp.]